MYTSISLLYELKKFKDTDHFGCDVVVSLGYCFPAFRRNVEGSKENLLEPLYPEDEGTIQYHKSLSAPRLDP